jgi:hypothetical protein
VIKKIHVGIRRIMLSIVLMALIMPSIVPGFQAVSHAAEVQSDEGNLAFFAKAKMGLFVHYTYSFPGYEYGHTYDEPGGVAVSDVNALANGFDAEAFANVAESMGVEYVTFTVFHAGMSALFPSQVLENLMPGKAAERDVIRDLLDELTGRNIKLVLYFHPVDGHDLTSEQQVLTGWGNYSLWNDFINDLVDEIGKRYGEGVAGFWLDGAPGTGQIDGPRLKETIRSNNPDAAVWVNYGIRYNDNGVFTGLSDFVASETMGGVDPNTDNWLTSIGQENNRVTAEWWARYNTPIQFSAESMLRYTVRIAGTLGQRNGGVQWATGPYANNEWEPGVEVEFARLGDRLEPIRSALFNTAPSTSYITQPHTTQNNTWGVATDSLDGQYVYLHVLNAPAGQTLHIGQAFDGREFNEAQLLTGDVELQLNKNISGYSITLPETVPWDVVDTVIRLKVSKPSETEQWRLIENVKSIGISEWVPTGIPRQFTPIVRGFMANGESIVLDNRFIQFTAEPSSAITVGENGVITGIKPGVTKLSLSINENIVTSLFPGIQIQSADDESYLLFNGKTFDMIPVDFRKTGGFFTEVDVTSGINNELMNHVTVPEGLGFAFKTGANPITVSQLGRYYTAGSNRFHTLFIYDQNKNKVAETVINLAEGQADAAGFKYSPLPVPYVLQPNQDYYFTSSEEAGGDSFHNSGVTLTYKTSIGTVMGPYHGGDKAITGGLNRSYGPVSFANVSDELAGINQLHIEDVQLLTTSLGYVEVQGLRADEQREILNNQLMTLTANDQSIVSIEDNGVINPLKAGSTKVKAAVRDKPEVFSEFVVTVTDLEEGVELGPIDGNLALNAVVTSSSSVEAEVWAQQFAVDGNRGLDGLAPFGWTSGSELTVDHTEWLKLDLGKNYPISRVDLYPRNDPDREGYGFPIDFTIQLSNDNVRWSTVVAETGYDFPEKMMAQSFALDHIKVARYVKVVGTKLRSASFDADQFRMQLAEIEVYAPTASEVAAGINSISSPSSDATTLTLPGVPKGYTIAIESSSHDQVIALDGVIKAPSADTAVELVLKVTRTSDQQTALTLPMNVNILASNEAPPVNPGGPGGGTNPPINPGGSGGSTTPVIPSVDRTYIVNEQGLASGSVEGNVTLVLPEGKDKVSLPVSAAQLLGDRDLIITQGNVSVGIPPAVLSQLTSQGGITEAGSTDSRIIVRMQPSDSDDAGKGLAAGFVMSGQSYSFELILSRGDGQEFKLSEFPEPVMISIPYEASKVDEGLLGIYYFNESNKTWEYVGGVINKTESKVSAQVSHFSQYALMEYDRSYSDVPNTHWAYRMLKELSAKHIAQGVTTAEYKPNDTTTRAEFAALLVRALGLKANEIQLPFEDVDNKAWYAQAVAAAYQSGVLKGVSSTLFAPNQKITREQMAVMIIRALEISKGLRVGTDEIQQTIQDLNEVSSWAREDILSALDLKVMQGRSSGHFAPKAHAQRAEAAQVIYNLLKLMN